MLLDLVVADLGCSVADYQLLFGAEIESISEQSAKLTIHGDALRLVGECEFGPHPADMDGQSILIHIDVAAIDDCISKAPADRFKVIHRAEHHAALYDRNGYIFVICDDQSAVGAPDTQSAYSAILHAADRARTSFSKA